MNDNGIVASSGKRNSVTDCTSELIIENEKMKKKRIFMKIFRLIAVKLVAQFSLSQYNELFSIDIKVN
jgi:hypothetical protein